MKLRYVAALFTVLTMGHSAMGADEIALPKVLIIGDSISIGYTPFATELLAGKAEVTHNPGNAAHTNRGRASLDEWLGDTKWDVIHFNFGLHDLKYVDDQGENVFSKEAGHIQVPLEKYRENLEAIVWRLEKTGAKLVFATTTPYPAGLTNPLREVEDVAKYNAAALDVMAKQKVMVDDLHAFAEPRLSELQRPQNVHFTDEGSKALGEQVAKAILAALDKSTES